MTVPDWHEGLVCGKCGSGRVDFIVTGTTLGDKQRLTK
jgi:hypothetical protein